MQWVKKLFFSVAVHCCDHTQELLKGDLSEKDYECIMYVTLWYLKSSIFFEEFSKKAVFSRTIQNC